MVDFAAMKGPGTDRDWALVRASKVAYWRTLDPVVRLRLADELRLHALHLHPDWPTAEQRTADHAGHTQLAERFEHAASSRKR